jgi:pimeloyl-ACP methyl ester carboxylesterase
MTTPLRRASRLRARLGRLGRAVTAFRWRRAMASRAPSTRFARNGPVTIAYDVRGRGAPLVLIQGVGIGRWGWEPVADRLARRFQVITIDNRGVGASDTPPGHFTTRSMAQDVLAVLDHAGIEHASVLGTSLGGYLMPLAAGLAAAGMPRRWSSDPSARTAPRQILRWLWDTAWRTRCGCRSWPGTSATRDPRRVAGTLAHALGDPSEHKLPRSGCQPWSPGAAGNQLCRWPGRRPPPGCSRPPSWQWCPVPTTPAVSCPGGPGWRGRAGASSRLPAARPGHRGVDGGWSPAAEGWRRWASARRASSSCSARAGLTDRSTSSPPLRRVQADTRARTSTPAASIRTIPRRSRTIWWWPWPTR